MRPEGRRLRTGHELAGTVESPSAKAEVVRRRIVVDDGASDRAPEMLDAVLRKFRRVEAMHRSDREAMSFLKQKDLSSSANRRRKLKEAARARV